MRCLIAEDDLTTRKILKHFMSAHAEADLAEDGQEAVEKFEAAIDAGTPYDMICLDVNMPRMDGRAALAEIRRIEEERNVAAGQGARVVMITSDDDAKNVVAAFKKGAEFYLVKPISKEDVARAVEQVGLAAESA